MQNSDKLSCEKIEDILIHQKINGISEDEQQRLLAHLETCENCKNQQIIVNNILMAAEIDQNSELMPKPEIR